MAVDTSNKKRRQQGKKGTKKRKADDDSKPVDPETPRLERIMRNDPKTKAENSPQQNT
jgi:hypothetical protein